MAKKTVKLKRAINAKPKPGLKPDILKIDGNWVDVVKKSFAKKKPPEGWPKQ